MSYNPFGYHGFGVNARLIYKDKVYVDLPTCTTPLYDAYRFQESTHELGNPLPYSIVPRMLGFGYVLKKWKPNTSQTLPFRWDM